ncbi:MAG: hypothetical protein ACLPY5_07070 [Candidatus Bathyarchaeia archaeon]
MGGEPARTARMGGRELGLTMLAVLACGVSAQFLVFGTLGLLGFELYRNLLLIPSVALVLIIAGYARHYERRLGNRLIMGLLSGLVATVGLELFRVPGYAVLHWLPGDDMVSFPGVLLTGVASNLMEAMPYMALKEPAPIVALLAGGLWHFWNGATFGAVYAMVMGKGKWWYGAIWGSIIEQGMMVAPWLVMMVGPYGIHYGAGYNIVTVTWLAHIAFGSILGLLVYRLVKEKGSILTLLRAPNAGGKRSAGTSR